MKQKTSEADPENATADLGNSEITAGCNFNAPNAFTFPRDTEQMHYYHAADRPQFNGGSVNECLTLGYERCTDLKSFAPGHVLMQKPQTEYRRGLAEERRRRELNLAPREADIPEFFCGQPVPTRKDKDHGISLGVRE